MTDFPVELPGARASTLMWANEWEVEAQALQQLRNIAELPWVHGLRVMPDVHFGKGATVGSVIAMKQAISPAAVGVDIGCGMEGVKTNLTMADLPDNLAPLRSALEAVVPVGFNSHEDAVNTVKLGMGDLKGFWSNFTSLHDDVQKLEGKAHKQLGTLGGGNHFIELCNDENDDIWIMLHSGSRNIGKELAERHMKIARELEHNQGISDKDLAVFLANTPEMTAYRHDLSWAQDFARLSRQTMLRLICRELVNYFDELDVSFDEPISCHHNYVAEETIEGEQMLVTRKGAIRAGLGDMGLIPGSMGTGSYVVRGLGSEKSFWSASHGAGRRMSRGAAKRTFTVEDLAEQTQGVECRKDSGVVDEIPGAYKDINQVIAAQSDLVEVVAFLKQVICIKG